MRVCNCGVFFSSRPCSSEVIAFPTPGNLGFFSRTLRGSTSPSAGRLRQEPSVTKNCCHIELEISRSNSTAKKRSTTIPSTEPYSSITEVPILERAFDLDTDTIWFFLSKDNELRTECRKVQFRHFLI